jgi:hypothetical protein
MELALVLRELWGRKRLLLLGLIVSAFAAWYSLNSVSSLLPPKFQPRSLEYSAASATAFADWPTSFAGDTQQNIEPLVQRTMIYANLMASPGMLDLAGPVDPNVAQIQEEPTAQKRNVQITGESAPYKLNFYVDPNLPVITFYTQAPNRSQAIALANASVRALSTYVSQIQHGQRIPAAAQVVIRPAGQATAAVVDAGIRKKLGGAVFVAAFVAWCALVLIAMRLKAYWRAAGIVTRRPEPTAMSGDMRSSSDLEDWTTDGNEESLLEPEPANT